MVDADPLYDKAAKFKGMTKKDPVIYSLSQPLKLS